MELTTYQNFERRNAQDQIIRPGTWGKNTALTNDQNTGILDYIANNLDWLKINKAEAADVEALMESVTALAEDFAEHTSDNTIHVTTSDRENWNDKVDKDQNSSNAGKIFYVDSLGRFDFVPGYKFKDGVLCVEVAD